jgi:hypothetical protein
LEQRNKELKLQCDKLQVDLNEARGVAENMEVTLALKIR